MPDKNTTAGHIETETYREWQSCSDCLKTLLLVARHLDAVNERLDVLADAMADDSTATDSQLADLSNRISRCEPYA